MDHEFSSSQLTERQVGWDWFSIQFDDGRDVMLYVLRDAQGNVDFASGTWVAADGAVTPLSAVDFTIAGRRRDERSLYPLAFDVTVKGERFTIEAASSRCVNASVLVDGIEYFEGPIEVRRDGVTVGRGYVELTGYDPDAKLPI